MSGMLSFLAKQDPKTLLAALLLVVAGATLNKLIPFLWRGFIAALAWLGRRVGGRFAFRYFERTYLDWLVTQLRELKLTGIVTSDAAKKPRLEQVFVSLRMGGERDEISFMDCAIAVCNEVRRNPRRRRGLLDALKRDLERAPSEQRKEAEEYIARNLKERSSLGKFGQVVGASSGIFSAIRQATSVQQFIRSIVFRMSMAGVLSEKETNESEYLNILFNEVLRQNRRLAILGPPGSGKSTLLQYIGLAYAKARAGDSKLRAKKCHRKTLGALNWRLPVFIPLSTISKALTEPLQNGNSRTLLDVLPTILPPDLQNDPSVSKFFKRKMAAGECIVLFDGLDEVPTEEEFKAVVGCIESFTVAHPDNQCIVTSRIAGWRSGVHADFKVFYLAELNESQIDSFITIWCEAVEKNGVIGRLEDEGQADQANRRRRAVQHARQLRAAIRSNRGMRQLASNPMLLSIIALVHQSLPDLPKERTKLYSECSKILLEQWDMSKGRRVDDTHLRLEQKETILRRIAFALHTGEIGKKGGSREASRGEVQTLLSSVLPNFNMLPSDAERLLTRLIERSGVIVERQRDVLAFSHLTFQEYFVASYLTKNKHGEFLLHDGRLFTDWWREASVMYSGLLDDSSEFLRSLHKVNHWDLFSTKLLLAGTCLGESHVVKQASVRESICADLARLRTLGKISGPASDFRELSGYLSDWCRSESARRHAVAFAITCTAGSSEKESHLVKLSKAIRDGDPEDVRLSISALQLVPGLQIVDLADAICVQVGKRDSRTSANCLKLLSRILPAVSNRSLSTAFETALDDGDYSVRIAALEALREAGDVPIVTEMEPKLERLLTDSNWRVRQEAAKVCAVYVKGGRLGYPAKLMGLIDKEDDIDVLEAMFQSIRAGTPGREMSTVCEELRKLLTAKNEKVRPLALATILQLLDGAKEIESTLLIIRGAMNSKSEAVLDALVDGFRRLKDNAVVEQCIEFLSSLCRAGHPLEKAAALQGLGALRHHQVWTEQIDRELYAGLRSNRTIIRRASALGIGQCDSIAYDDESYRILLSMAGSRSSKTKLSALKAISSTLTASRGSAALDVLRRALSSDNPRIRAAAARSAERMGTEARALKGVLLDVVADASRDESAIYPNGVGGIFRVGPIFISHGDYQFEAAAKDAARRALVSLIEGKADVQELVEEVSKKIDSSRKPHFGLSSVVLILGNVADKFSSLRSLECVLRVLRLIDEDLEGFSGEFIFISDPSLIASDGNGILQKELVAIGKRLRGRDVVRLVKNALETQGAISKTSILRALPEFDPAVRLELLPTVRELANNDTQTVRDAAWDSMRDINIANGSWTNNEPAAFPPPLAPAASSLPHG